MNQLFYALSMVCLSKKIYPKVEESFDKLNSSICLDKEFDFDFENNNNNNNIHLYSADSILICSSALYNSIKVGVCYACTYVCVCMRMYVYVCL